MRTISARWLQIGIVALAGLALVAFVACGGSSGGEEASSHGEGGVETVGDELVVTIRTEQARFVPDTVAVKVGQTVRLKLDNHDAALHDYTVDEAEFLVLESTGSVHEEHESVPPGDEHAAGDDHAGDEMAGHEDEHGMNGDAQVSLTPLHIAADANQHAELVFEATEEGEYVFYCSVAGHRELGMEGKIIVQG